VDKEARGRGDRTPMVARDWGTSELPENTRRSSSRIFGERVVRQSFGSSAEVDSRKAATDWAVDFTSDAFGVLLPEKFF
jgi:hypothetical protein